jgi:ribosome-binding factor A
MSRNQRARHRSARPDPTPDDLFGAVADDPHARKLDPLCAQIADAIAMALATASDPVLRDLSVATVEPRRGAASLRVVLIAAPGDELAIAADHAARAVGYLRAEVAAAIQRRRTPDLVVDVIAASAVVTP